MSDPLTAVVKARDAYLAAREQVTRTRLELGRAIAEARAQDVDQVAIARELGLTREQIRRYQAEYETRRTLESMGRDVRNRVGISGTPKFAEPPEGTPDGR